MSATGLKARKVCAAMGAVLAIVGGGVATTLGAGDAAAAPTGTAMVQTQKMSDATLKSTQFGWYPKGSALSLVCYKRGQAVSGYYSKYFANGRDDLWYKVSDGGFVADIDISTGTNNPITGPCGGAAPAPAAQGSRETRALAWARGQVGSNAYNFACQRFVENAFGTSGRYGSAIQMFNALRAAGTIHGGNAPAGALVFSRSSYDQGYGHVSIANGDGRYVSGGMPGPTVGYMRAPAASGGTYLGWSYAPGSWPGR